MEIDGRTFKYTSTFTSVARVIREPDSDRFIAKASLQPMRSLLPAGIDLENSDDVLFCASNGALAGLANRNGDSLTAKTALSVYKSALYKFISTDHDRTKVCGAIINAGLTRFGSNEPLTDEEAATLQEPFNMAVAFVLWKVIQSQLPRYLIKVGDATDEFALSLSWEIAFDSFDLAIGAKNLFDAKIVKAGDPDYNDLVKCLRAEGGKGVTKDGQPVYRVITGDPVILGYSIVSNPAAEVKGILPILPRAESEVEDSTNADAEVAVDTSTQASTAPDTAPVDTPSESTPTSETTSEESAANEQSAAPVSTASAEIFITPHESRVTPIIAPMKIDSIDQIEANWPALAKLEAKAGVEAIMSAIQKGNTDWEQKLTAEKNIVKDLEQSKASIEQAKAAAETRANELEQSLADVRKQLNELKSQQVAAEADRKFQERMASFDEQYELDDEDRELIASDLKGMTDESFAAYAKKSAKLMSGKKKAAKPTKSNPDPDDDGDDDTSEEGDTDHDYKGKGKGKKAKASEDVNVKEALASVTEIPGQATVPPGKTETDVSLAEQLDDAFGESIKIGGKSLKTRRAEKAAKQPKE